MALEALADLVDLVAPVAQADPVARLQAVAPAVPLQAEALVDLVAPVVLVVLVVPVALVAPEAQVPPDHSLLQGQFALLDSPRAKASSVASTITQFPAIGMLTQVS